MLCHPVNKCSQKSVDCLWVQKQLGVRTQEAQKKLAETNILATIFQKHVWQDAARSTFCNLHSHATGLRFCSLASLQAHMAHSQDSCIDWPISLSEPFHPCHDAQSFIYFIPGYRSTKQLDVSCGQGGFVDYLWGWPALVFEINQHGGTPQQCKENCCTPKGPLSKKQTTHCWTIQGNNSHNHMSCPYIYIFTNSYNYRL